MKNPLKVAVSTLSIAALALVLSACSPTTDHKTPAPSPTVTPTPLLSVAKLTGRSTQLTLSKDFLADLKAAKISAKAEGTASLGNSNGTPSYNLPITGGTFSYYNPKVRKDLPAGIFQGAIQHSGAAILLSKGSASVAFQDLLANVATSGTVIGDAYLNGKPSAPDAQLFKLDAATLKPLSQDASGNALLSGPTFKLTAASAKVLNKQFSTDVFKSNETLGSATFSLKIPKGQK